MSEEEKEVEALTDHYVAKWRAAMKTKGCKITAEGLKRYRESAKAIAKIKVMMSRRRS